MAMATISCYHCRADITYNPNDYKNTDQPSITCGNCGLNNPLTEDEIQTPDNLE
jgi:hypothetical protein